MVAVCRRDLCGALGVANAIDPHGNMCIRIILLIDPFLRLIRYPIGKYPSVSFLPEKTTRSRYRPAPRCPILQWDFGRGTSYREEAHYWGSFLMAFFDFLSGLSTSSRFTSRQFKNGRNDLRLADTGCHVENSTKIVRNPTLQPVARSKPNQRRCPLRLRTFREAN